jgi:glutamine synthetase
VNFISSDNKSSNACPRSLLKKAIDDLKAKHGLEVRIGVEIEFNVFKDSESRVPVETNIDTNFHSLASFLDDFEIIFK